MAQSMTVQSRVAGAACAVADAEAPAGEVGPEIKVAASMAETEVLASQAGADANETAVVVAEVEVPAGENGAEATATVSAAEEEVPKNGVCAEAKETTAAEAKEAPTDEDDPDVQVTAIVIRKPRPKAMMAFKRKAFSSLVEKSVEEAITDAKGRVGSAQRKVDQLVEKQVAQEKIAEEAWTEFEQSRAEVDAKMDAELQAAKKVGELKLKKKQEDERQQGKRKELMEAMQMLAVMEFMQSNQEKMQQIQERKKQAEEELQRFRQQQKDMKLEQRKLLKGSCSSVEDGTGGKRTLEASVEEPPSKRIAGAGSASVDEDEQVVPEGAEDTQIAESSTFSEQQAEDA